MELRDYLRILRKYWIYILVTTLVGGSVAAGVSSTAIARYSSKSQLYVSVRQDVGDGVGDLVDGTNFATQSASSYVAIVDSAQVLEPVVDELGLDLTVQQLAAMVSAESLVDTVLLDITVTSTDAIEASEIANAVSESVRDFVEDTLEKREGASLSPVAITIVQPATPASSPASSNGRANTLLGLLIGLAAGIAFAVLRTALNTRVHSLRDIEDATDRPILGGVAFDPNAKKRPLVVSDVPHGSLAESYRMIRTNLRYLDSGDIPRSVVITSAVAGEGTSTAAANIAISMADAGLRVALIDGNLRAPRLARYFGLDGTVGLSDVLIGDSEVSDALQKWGRTELYVLPSGRVAPNPSELLGSAHMAKLLESLAAQFDYIIVDSPPLLLVTDAAVLSKLVGGAVVVVAAGRSKKAEVTDAVHSLDRISSRTLGLLITMVPTKGADASAYGTYGNVLTHGVAEGQRLNQGKRRVSAQRD